jgi:Respiratory-chain NADH dehydrogenase, 49 Kd subunit
MGLTGVLAAWAKDAPARVFPIVGRDARMLVDALRDDDRLHFVDSPRSATLLLVAGQLPEALRAPARAMHDAMAHPRATIRWSPGAEADDGGAGLGGTAVSGGAEAVIQAMVQAHQDLVLGRRDSEPDLLPDEDPAPWRGVGPYGQGGKGMTGGVPFGRPLAERAPDRDGLELDQLPIRIGPFFRAFPPGLVLDVRLQGDVIQSLIVGDNPFGSSSSGHFGHSGVESAFRRALDEPVSIATLELARADHHLRWLALALHVHGLGALGRRARRLTAGGAALGAEDVRALGRLLERTRALGWATAAVGVFGGDALQHLPRGPITRAAGIPADARSTDPAYSALGFEPVVHEGNDARARWRQRLAEAAQSVELAHRAGGRTSTPGQAVESPRGALSHEASPSTALVAELPSLLAGTEWGDAVTTVVSLDLDLEAAARIEAAA